VGGGHTTIGGWRLRFLLSSLNHSRNVENRFPFCLCGLPFVALVRVRVGPEGVELPESSSRSSKLIAGLEELELAGKPGPLSRAALALPSAAMSLRRSPDAFSETFPPPLDRPKSPASGVVVGEARPSSGGTPAEDAGLTPMAR
jgi:hypothetical protein